MMTFADRGKWVVKNGLKYADFLLAWSLMVKSIMACISSEFNTFQAIFCGNEKDTFVLLQL